MCLERGVRSSRFGTVLSRFRSPYHPCAPFSRVSLDGSGHPISGINEGTVSGTMVPLTMLPMVLLMVFPIVARTILLEFRRNVQTSRRRCAPFQRVCVTNQECMWEKLSRRLRA